MPSSTLPIRRITSSSAVHSAIRCVPQRPQNQRSLPGLDSKLRRTPSPFVQRKPARFARAVVAKAALCAFWQVRQWQWPIGLESASAS